MERKGASSGCTLYRESWRGCPEEKPKAQAFGDRLDHYIPIKTFAKKVSDYASQNRIICIVVAVVGVIAVIGIVILCVKNKTLRNWVMVMAQARPAVTQWVGTKLPECVIPNYSEQPTWLDWVTAGVIFLCVLIYVCKEIREAYLSRYVVYKASNWFQWSKQRGKFTTVLLELGNHEQVSTLFVQDLVGAPPRFYVLPEEPDCIPPQIRLTKRICGDLLYIHWGNTHLYDSVAEQACQLPLVIAVPVVLKQTTRQILANTTTVRLLIGAHGVYASYHIYANAPGACLFASGGLPIENRPTHVTNPSERASRDSLMISVNDPTRTGDSARTYPPYGN